MFRIQRRIAPIGLLSALTLTGLAHLAQAQTTPTTILAQTQEVSAAQLKSLEAQNRNPLDWIGGTMWVGVADFGRVSQRPLESDAIQKMGRKANWKILTRKQDAFHADDDCIGQAFLEAYADSRDPEELKAIRSRMDALVAHLSDPATDQTKLTWWWCDALFMAPPVLARLSNLTGDSKYIDAMDKQWWKVTARLYDPQDHLFYRDDRFLTAKSKNGHKVFWSRGNGWVMAGLVRVLTWMPRDYPSRPQYEQLFRDMAARLLALQGNDGAWRASLLDTDEFPEIESSGTAFDCYAFAWGINNGLLPREIYAPAALRAWKVLMDNRRPDGLPGWVQQVGDKPGPPRADGTQLYGTGGVLMAGTELLKLTGSGPQPF